jgi:20S proteasome alpha/beta subunit
MTIAAGFHLKEFIVMFSDTEYTKGNTVYDGPKIFPKRDYPVPVRTCFAIAGSVPNARQAIRKIEEEVGKLDALHVSQSAVIDAAEAALQPIYDRLRQRQDYWLDGGPQFYLLMSVWAGGATELYANYEDVVNEVHEAEFIGSGETFARYVTAPIFDPKMSLVDAIGLANYALTITKQNVSSCGKRNHIVVIPKIYGEAVVLPYDKIRELEKTQAFFQELIQKTFFMATVPDMPPDGFEAHVTVLRETIEKIKERQKRNHAAYKALTDRINSRTPCDPTDLAALSEHLEDLKATTEEAERLWIEMAFTP